jgi:hypothetical protein
MTLSELRYSRDAAFDLQKLCLPGTRLAILQEIMDWVSFINVPSHMQGKRILLLHGMAGTGKSTIVNTLASRYRALNRLGAFFCFKRGDKKRTAKDMFYTIARNLADLEEGYKLMLYNEIESDTRLRTSGKCLHEVGAVITNTASASPMEQYERLISGPLNKLTLVGEVIIVIDALDECEDRSEILAALARNDLPPNVRLIVTARPEDDIMRSLGSHSHTLPRRLGVDEEGIDSDLLVYVKAQFQKAGMSIGEADIRDLSAKAGGLFQWASTACLHITGQLDGPGRRRAGTDPQTRLKTILSADCGLDSIYHAILRDTLSPDASERAPVLAALSKIVATTVPLSLSVLKELCSAKEEERIAMDRDIPMLGSVLDVHHPTAIRPIHTSFGDYLTNRGRSQEFWVNLDQAHQDLAIFAFTTMNKELKFNMFGISTSHCDITTLIGDDPQRLLGHGLYYSCRHWMDHLCATNASVLADLLPQIKTFMSEKLLFWIEVMCATKHLDVAIGALGDSRVSSFVRELLWMLF